MSPLAPLILLLAPAALLVAAAIAHREPGARPARALAAAGVATAVALGAALASALALAALGPATSPALGVAGIGLSLRLDALSVTLLMLVAFIGGVVVRFSRNYLDGDPRQGAFTGNLLLTLAAVSLLVTAGNLLLLVLAWVGTSLALHRLLLFYPERPGARAAARKKSVFARIGDACLLGAAALLVVTFDTGDIASISAAARAGETAPPLLAGVLIAMAALLKSAQFPSHGWLTEVMETPTPVSALLHAGIVNAGGFLVVRFADVMLAAPGALVLLALVGGFTALLASVSMRTQSSTKAALAWSTAAQMGFMLLQCGLGAFTSAVLHIVAHSLYKAHAFLAAGSAVEAAAPAALAGPRHGSPDVRLAAGCLLAAIAVVLATGATLGFSVEEKPVIVALGAVLVLGLGHLFVRSLESRSGARGLARAGLAALMVSAAYFALQAGAAALLAGAVPDVPAADTLTYVLVAMVVASFTAVSLLQVLGPRLTGHPLAHRAWVLAASGLHANALVDRLTGSLRCSPVRTAPEAS